ncbi:MAG: 4'-phosphopantetheinyl transferase family protein, partial [Beijerinckiaceae bacterium]
MTQIDGPVARAVARARTACFLAVEESNHDDASFPLTPAEEARLAGAALKRRREFRTGRRLATAACARWGLDRPTLEPDRRGAPIWPARVVGSISHCETWAAAAVASRDDVWSVGIDVEPAEPLPSDVVGIVLTSGERARLGQSDFGDVFAGCADRLMFCAKEAVFKAWYPLTKGWLDFDDVEIDLRSDGRWSAHRGGRGRRLM